MGLPKVRRRVNNNHRNRTIEARKLTCGAVMILPKSVTEQASVFDVLELITSNNWDHLYVVNNENVPLGRVHAVDVLKLVARKTVNRDVAWMHTIPATRLVQQPPLQISMETPLLKAAALLLAHDLNQLAVIDNEGALVGVVSHSVISRHLPKFLL